MQQNMTKGNPLTIILSFTLPLFIGNMFQQIYNTVDSMIVGQFLGKNAFAAVGSTGTIMFMIIGLANGLCTGFTVLVSQKYGEGNVDATKKSVANGTILSAIIVVIMTTLSVILLPFILKWMNTPKKIYEDAYNYINVICLGIFANIAYNYLAACLRAIGNSRVPLFMLIFSSVLNIVLDLLLVKPLGTAGAALATVISQALAAVLCYVYILKKEPLLQPEKSMYRLQKAMSKQQLSVGVPMALQFGITGSGTVIMQAAINLFSENAMAAYSAANKINTLMIQGPIALGQTMATFAGQNFGARIVKRIKQGVKYALMLDVIYSVIAGLVVYFGLEFFIQFFFNAQTDMNSIMEYAKPYIAISVTFFIPLSVIFTFRNTMQGCGYGFLPMMGGVVELIARLVCSVIAMYTMNYFMACFCDPAAWFAAAVFTMVSYLFVIKRIERQLHSN